MDRSNEPCLGPKDAEVLDRGSPIDCACIDASRKKPSLKATVASLQKGPGMRNIYIYDLELHRIIESYNVTEQSDFNCELLKLRLLGKCRYPWDVFDSLIDDMDETAAQYWPENMREILTV